MSKTVDKAVRALEVLAGGPKKISELARELDVHSSTALRMLQPLVDSGMLARGPDGRYRLGLRLADLGQQVLEDMDLRATARPRLVALAEDVRATVHLAQLIDEQIVYVDKIESSASIRTWSRIGRPVPLHTAAASKAILARLPERRREELLAAHSFTRHTENTLADAAALRGHLRGVVERGYATDDAEFEPLVHCVGVAVPANSGQVAAAVSVTTVRARPDPAEQHALVTKLRETAAALGAELGTSPR
ncbi:IclR family transcriptional regulator [Salinifilum ghardaiensis]